MTPEEQAEYGVQIGVDYPEPIPASKFARPLGGHHVGGDPGVPLGATSSKMKSGKLKKAMNLQDPQ